MHDEWVTWNLEDLAAETRNAIVGGPFGSELVSADYVEVGVPVIRGENVASGRWVVGPFAQVSPAKAASLAANSAGAGDVIFTQRGANHFRQIGVVPSNAVGRYIVSQSQMKLTVDRRRVEPLFVYYLFRAPETQAYLQRNAIQTGVPHTNLGILRKMPLRIPSLATQRRFLGVVGTLDDKIELNRRMSETLEAMARALFTSWFVDFDPVRAKAEGRDTGLPKEIAGLFPDSFEDSELGEIPRGWGVGTIGDLTEVVGGTTPSTKSPEYWEGGRHAWATPKDLSALDVPVLLQTERTITDLGLAQIGSGLLPPGTVLLSSRAPIGYLAIAEVPVAINQGFIAMVPRPGVSNLYLLHWAGLAKEVILSRANGSTFLEISKSNFRAIPAVVPPQPVLEAFDAIVAPHFRRVVGCTRNSAALAATRDALLPRLLSGELGLPRQSGAQG